MLLRCECTIARRRSRSSFCLKSTPRAVKRIFYCININKKCLNCIMELMQGASLLSRPADEFGNDGLVEELWAVKAMDHAEVHFNLLTSVHPSYLRLTPYDDQIYEIFRQDFPDLKVDVLSDDKLKSPMEKAKWRIFAEKFNKMEDYSFGTLMRADASQEFSPENSVLVVRVQFLAIEIARNREGLNDAVHNKYKPSPKTNAIEEEDTTTTTRTKNEKH